MVVFFPGGVVLQESAAVRDDRYLADRHPGIREGLGQLWLKLIFLSIPGHETIGRVSHIHDGAGRNYLGTVTKD